MLEPRVWRIDGSAWIFVAILALFAVVGITGLVSGKEGALPFLLLVGILLALAARCPYRVSVSDDGMIAVKSFAGTRVTHAQQVYKVARRGARPRASASTRTGARSGSRSP